MKILVSAKRVIDPDARIKLLGDASGVDTESVEYKLNPFDENAIEEALQIKDNHDAEVIVVSIGGEEITQTIRSGLAMGADRAIRVESQDAALDSDLAARIFAAIFKKEEPTLFLLGKQAIDGDNNQVAQLLAQYLGLPQACFVSELDFDGSQVTATREIDGGLEKIAMSTPAIVSADLRLNEPRYASLPGIMKAKRKTIDVLTLDDLGVQDTALKVEVVRLEEPASRAAGVMVESVDELMDKLTNEARVL